MPWFRLYTEMIDDAKLRILAFEDRWHYVAILCCKRGGLLDTKDSPELLAKKLAIKLGLHRNELDLVADRLAEAGLIDKKTFQPLAWDKRQFASDCDPTSTIRKRRQRAARMAVTGKSRGTSTNVTRTDTDTDTEAEKQDQKKKHAASAEVLLKGVSPAVIQDFKSLRNRLRAPITDTAVKGIKREATKAGMSLQDALVVCCERSWRGFKAEWIADRNTSIPTQSGPGSRAL